MDQRPRQATSLTYEVRSGDGIVFLDLEDDAYYCIYQPEPSRISGQSSVAKAQNSACATPGISKDRWRSVSVPRQTLTPSDMARFFLALLKTVVKFRGRGIAQLIKARGTGPVVDQDERALVEASARFAALLRLLPIMPECLFRSLFLLNFLKLSGFTADWVFGVHLFPFRAHCWVAHDDILLNEEPHRIENYQTILVARAPAL